MKLLLILTGGAIAALIVFAEFSLINVLIIVALTVLFLFLVQKRNKKAVSADNVLHNSNPSQSADDYVNSFSESENYGQQAI